MEHLDVEAYRQVISWKHAELVAKQVGGGWSGAGWESSSYKSKDRVNWPVKSQRGSEVETFPWSCVQAGVVSLVDWKWNPHTLFC